MKTVVGDTFRLSPKADDTRNITCLLLTYYSKCVHRDSGLSVKLPDDDDVVVEIYWPDCNTYTDLLFREAISGRKEGIKMNDENINNLRYADDTVLIADSEEDLQVLINPVVEACDRYGYNWNHPAVERRELMVQTLAPSFDEMTTEVVARVGQTLLLPCTVKNLGSKVVSWIRSKDLHILTSGRHTFTGDSRFESVHSDSSGDFWGLRIRGVHVSDTGQYECQVNTEPKMSLAISLIVTDSGGHNSDASNSKWVSQALIKGPDAVYVQNGSPVTFTCEISPLSLQSGAYGLFFTTKPPVRWLHDWKEVSFEYQRNNISIETEYGDNDQRILSRIHLPTVSWKDSGQYTCMQPSTKPGSVKLIVVEGEHSEAMQRDFPIISSVATSRFQFLYIISILINFM